MTLATDRSIAPPSETSDVQSAASAQHARLPEWAADAIVIFVVLSTSLFPAPRPPFLHSMLLLGPVATLAAACLLLLRRRWPIPIFAACLLLYCATAAFGVASLGAGIAAVFAAYGMADRAPRRIAFLWGGTTAALVVVLSVTAADFGVVDPRIFQIAAGIAVATALGDSSRSRREYLLAVTERAERAEQTREAEARRRVAEERLRIAQDLHDTVAHRIAVIGLHAGAASGALEDRPEKARESLGTIRSAARGVLADIGELLRYLRSEEPGGEVPPPQVGLQQLDALLQRMRGAGLDVQVDATGDLSPVTGAVDLVAYRAVQEGLTNAHKHGAGHRAHARIDVDDRWLRIVVSNPVPMPESDRAEALGDGLGLIGVHERVASVGGGVRAEVVGGTFVLNVEIPLIGEAGA